MNPLQTCVLGLRAVEGLPWVFKWGFIRTNGLCPIEAVWGSGTVCCAYTLGDRHGLTRTMTRCITMGADTSRPTVESHRAWRGVLLKLLNLKEE